jgi:hypothetical protein
MLAHQRRGVPTTHQGVRRPRLVWGVVPLIQKRCSELGTPTPATLVIFCQQFLRGRLEMSTHDDHRRALVKHLHKEMAPLPLGYSCARNCSTTCQDRNLSRSWF